MLVSRHIRAAPTGAALQQSYWLWVTRPEHYLDNKRREPRYLDPERCIGLDDWTCHKETKRGDLALLWRTHPYCDIAYLFQAKSDAHENRNYPDEVRRGWLYSCDCRPIFRFEQPLSLGRIKSDPHLENWNALRANFQKLVFRFDLPIWRHISNLLTVDNPSFQAALKKVSGRISLEIRTEEELEERLASNLAMLKPRYNLEIWHDENGVSGRQYICKGYGRIDLLCTDKRRGTFTVIELKNTPANDMVFSQIHGYMSWVATHVARGKAVKGLVISRGCDARFRAHLQLENKGPNPINQIDIDTLDLRGNGALRRAHRDS